MMTMMTMLMLMLYSVLHVQGPRRGERRAPWVSKYGAPTRTKYALKVLNLSSRISWQDLKDLLRRAGEVCFAEAHTEARNEGRVELATSEDLERVVKRYQGYDLNGRKIELVREKYKSRSRSRSRRRTRSPSRSRSRRRSRSRSKSRSRSHSSNKSRSKSVQSKVDPEDQDVKRQRRHSRDSKDSRPKSRNSNKESSAELHKSESQTREEDLVL